VPGILFTTLALYPFIESWVTGDKREHHILDRPRNAPVRTGIGVALVVSFLVLALAGSNDLIATQFHLSINDITMFLRVFIFVGPVLAFWITKRLCLGLQRRDRELVLHGHETGRILRFADGEYVEVHQPLDEDERWLLVQHEPHRPLQIAPETDARGVVRRGYRKDRFRQRLSQFFYQDRIEPVTPTELVAAHADASHDAIEGGAGLPQLESPVSSAEPVSHEH
jgi:ubiquinol-cytochrome c reductase cytochrome b subunit